MIASALMAHPLALSTGARLRRRSFNHAITMLGPLMTNRMQAKMISSCHHVKPLKSLATAANAVPIMPNAIPMAAKIPANLAISNVVLGAAVASPSFLIAASALVVMSSKALASFSAADLLIFSSTQLANLRYGVQKAWRIEMGLSIILVTVAS